MTEKKLKFYVCEMHKYARTFSFIAEIIGVTGPELEKVFVSDLISPLPDFWVEVKKEAKKIILAGSGFLNSHKSISDLRLIVEFEEHCTETYKFPSPTFIEQGTLSCNNTSKEESTIKFWSKNGLTDIAPVNYGQNESEPTLSSKSDIYIHEKKIARFKPGMVPFLPKAVPEQVLPQELFKSQKHSQCDEITALKDIHKGKDAVFIGNGPSLRLNALEDFNQHVFFAFNRFYLAYEQTEFRPDYLISADKQMIDDFGDEMIEKSESKVMLATEDSPDSQGSYLWLKLVNIFPALFSEDISKFVTPGGATPYVAMQIAAYMGIKNVYLLGFDYGYKFENCSNDLNSNFVQGEGNHFLKNYRNNMSWVPPSFRNIGHSFWTARLYFEACGGQIINLSPGSNLKVFQSS